MNLLHDDVQKYHAPEPADDSTCVSGGSLSVFLF